MKGLLGFVCLFVVMSFSLVCAFSCSVDGGNSLSPDMDNDDAVAGTGGGIEFDDDSSTTVPMGPSTGAEIPESSSGLYRDSTMTHATWTEITAGAQPDCAVGEWERTSVSVSDGVATITVIGTGWRGATVAQVPSNALSSSYFDFSNVAQIKMYIKSEDITAADIAIILQDSSGNNLIKSVAITNYGASSITDWTEITIPVASYSAEKIKALAVIPAEGDSVAVESSVQIKEIGFLDADGNNVDIAASVSYAGSLSSVTNGMTLFWSDEFDSCDSDTTPLSSKWGYDVGRGQSVNTDGTNPNNWAWGNNELQWYTGNDKDNAWVSDGTLKIKAVREPYDYNSDGTSDADWTSARLVTRNISSAEGKYGYIEMRAKIPEAAGVWPAFWMLRHDIYDEGGTGWPAGGEIDIMETSTNLWGVGTVYGTLHCTAGSGGSPIWTQGTQLSGIESDWHTYAVLWTEEYISWYFDGTLLGGYVPTNYENDAWPYDENFYIILNLAVGGNLGGEVPADLSSATMEVDYVRWYQ